MAADGLPVQTACRVLGVSESGYYAWKGRPPSARAIRHAWLTDLIRQIHADSRGVYVALRVHAELTLGHGITVGHNAVAMLVRRAGIHGLSGRRGWRRVPNLATAADLVDRQFARADPNRLWVTDITEHPTREGKVYCAVVLDVFSRRVVGWSIDASPTATLVTSALGMAIDQRRPAAGAVIHNDPLNLRNTPRGPSPAERWTPGWSRRWDRSGTATSVRRSGLPGESDCRVPAGPRPDPCYD
jgi:hypothetical protein